MQVLENKTEEKKTEIALRMDEFDEQQILAEIKGQIVEPYFYKYTKGDTEVTALSYAGVRFVAGKMADQGELLVLDHSEVTETDKFYHGKAVVRNKATGLIFVGMSEVSKTVPFAYILAWNKAERNGFRKHEPENVILLAHEQWKNKAGKVQDITPESQKPPTRNITPGKKETVVYDGSKLSYDA